MFFTIESDLKEVEQYQEELSKLMSSHEFYMTKLSSCITNIKVPEDLIFVKEKIEHEVSSIKQYYENMVRLNKDTDNYLRDILSEIEQLINQIGQLT